MVLHGSVKSRGKILFLAVMYWIMAQKTLSNNAQPGISRFLKFMGIIVGIISMRDNKVRDFS